MRYCLTQKLFANSQISAYFLHAKQDFQETTTIKVELKGKKKHQKSLQTSTLADVFNLCQ